MDRFFSMDNKFFQIIDRLADLLWLNLLWLIFCIPIVTIGASTTAMYYVAMKMVRNEESYISKNFFHSFKQNFIQATVIWLLAVFFAVVIFIDIRVFGNESSLFFKASTVLLYAMAIIFLLILTYVFPMLAKFENSIINIIKNSLLISVLQIPYTILLIIMILIPFGVIWVIPYLIIVMTLFGGSGIAYATSHIYVKIFDKLIPQSEDEADNIN